jgi:carbon monoxide dehydrogenase subunit G
MLKIIVIAILVVIAAALVYASSRPDAFHVERTTNIKAPPEKIFPLIDDLHSWTAWSPYEKLDPAMKKTHSGAASGKGAVYAWEGNMQAGAGSIEIADTAPPSRVNIKLHMIKPFEGNNDVEFRLEPKGGGTDVTWAMDGKYNFLAKVMGLFMNMDKMVGGQFEEGLANLKKVAEQ